MRVLQLTCRSGLQVEQAQFAHLCTVMSNMHHRRAGYPFGTLVDFAVDEAGYPIFCLSPLAIHTRNIMEDPRCSLVVQMPGWTGLANARVTIFGDVYQLPQHLQETAREIFLQKQVHISCQLNSPCPIYSLHLSPDEILTDPNTGLSCCRPQKRKVGG